MWREELVERSWTIMNRLKTLSDFVLIGGWATYFWVRKLKSRDVDLCIDSEHFFLLQSKLKESGYTVAANPRLAKFEAKIEDVDVDIYTPFQSNLIIPCAEILDPRNYSVVEGFKVAKPETLIILKAQAAQDRWLSEKGFKDRADILSLLLGEIDYNELNRLLDKYDSGHNISRTLERVVSRSRSEYRTIGAAYEKHGVALKRKLTSRSKP